MAGSPDQAKQLVDRFVQREKIDLFTGPIASNVALAVAPTLFAAKVPYLSNNAGPSQLAGRSATPTFLARLTRTTSSTKPPASLRPTRNLAAWC
jgi:branched-chain amino acid transport system substrate-binding protein